MSGSQILAQPHIVRERQITGGGNDPVSPDDDGSVMKRSIVFKNVHQHLHGNQAVHTDPRALILIQSDSLLYHDQSAGLHPAHIIACVDNVILGLLAEADILLSHFQRDHGA